MNKLKPFGQIVVRKKYIVFYGNEYFTYEKLHQFFRYFYTLQQVHGNRVVKAGLTPKEADGHYTDKRGVPLVIRTADCLPVFFFKKECVFALHAGWRGLALQILTEATQILPQERTNELFIGPHIRPQSYEVDTRTVQNILNSKKMSLRKAFSVKIITPSLKKREHFYINLLKILEIEAQVCGFNQLSDSNVNTFSSYIHHSHRRNNRNKKRNLSFIMKL